MRAVGRIFAAMLGFLAAVIAAAAFLLVAKLGFSVPRPGAEAWYWGRAFVYGGMAASMLGAMAFVPGAVLILVTEILSIRSIIFHVGMGGLLGLAATLRIDRMHERMATDPGLSSDVMLMVAAGFVGGFVYWLIAGRMAGLKAPEPPGADEPRDLTPRGP